MTERKVTVLRAQLTNERPTSVERQLAMAQQITHIGSWRWNARTDSVEWSDELYRIYGLEPRSIEITFDSFLERVHPADRERVVREVTAALEKGARFGYDERIIRPDGMVRQLQTVGEADRDEEGRVVGLIGACRDVTDERERDETARLYTDIVHHAQIALSVWEVGQPDDPGSVRLVAFNPAAERTSLRQLQGFVGCAFRELFPYARGATFEQLLIDVARDGRVRDSIVRQSRNPHYPTRALAMRAFPLPGNRVGMAVDDITVETQARRLQEAENRVLEMIGTGAALPSILETLVLAIEEHARPAIASVVLLDAQGVHVRHAAAPHLPESYCRAIDGLPIGPTAGSCGTAAFLRRAVFVEDIATDPLWASYRNLALGVGLRACSSTPIVATDGRVLGTFALYYLEPHVPTDGDRELIERATHLAGIAIERAQVEEQLRALSARVESVREDERTGIAREIHDELGQSLTALKMDLAWVGRRLSSESDVSPECLLEKLRAMSDMTDDVIRQVRRISAELRPGVLDDLGLLAAIEWQAQEFEKRTSTTCIVHSNMDEAQLARDLSTAVFRIFQEALTNVARHAEANRVDVKLYHGDGHVRLEVTDDGKGVSSESLRSPSSLGLLGIRERARRLGGTATIRGVDPRGTSVSLDLPVSPSQDAERT
jgi:PAS domain S-box-containing protein